MTRTTGRTEGPARAAVDLDAVARGFMAARAVLSAVELGVFDALRTGARSVAQLAQTRGLDPAALEILLDALCGLGILDRSPAGYAVRPEVAAQVDPTSPASRSGSLEHLARLWQRWSQLTEIVRDGRDVPRGWSGDARQGLARAMLEQGRSVAPRLAAVLARPDVRRVLDLGGGPGAFSVALAQRCPDAAVVLFDRDDEALSVAREQVERERLDSRITLRQGDFLEDELGEDYDLVFVSAVLCLLSEAESAQLLRRARQALRPGGRLALREILLDADRAGPPEAALFSLNMLVASASGRVGTEDELRRALAHAGFEDVHRLPLAGISLMIARRPQAGGGG